MKKLILTVLIVLFSIGPAYGQLLEAHAVRVFNATAIAGHVGVFSSSEFGAKRASNIGVSCKASGTTVNLDIWYEANIIDPDGNENGFATPVGVTYLWDDLGDTDAHIQTITATAFFNELKLVAAGNASNSSDVTLTCFVIGR